MSAAQSSTLPAARASVAINSRHCDQLIGNRQQFFNAGCVRNHHLGAAVVKPVFDRFRAEQRKQRQRDRTEPVGRKMGDDGFGALRQQDADPVALA